MIIEIKNLPQDRNVKKVTFDIEFQDGEVQTVVHKNDIKINSEFTKPTIQKTELVQTPGLNPDDIPTIDTPKITDVGKGIFPSATDKLDNTVRPEHDVISNSTVYTGNMPVFKNNLTNETTPEGPNFRNVENRPQKEIPSEMTDMEF
jgi:hypothetical protein